MKSYNYTPYHDMRLDKLSSLFLEANKEAYRLTLEHNQNRCICYIPTGKFADNTVEYAKNTKYFYEQMSLIQEAIDTKYNHKN